MSDDLFTWFEKRFQDHLKQANGPRDAFDKTIETIGFEPYSSYKSFATVRSKRYKKSKRPKR